METLTERRKRAVWDWIDEHHPEWWETPEVFLEPDVLYILSNVTRGVTQNGSHATPEQVRKWFEDIREQSPFVDEVAVQRAVNLDYTVMAQLTRRERDEAVGRLAAMRDPFDLETVTREQDGTDRTPSRRRIAWMEWPEKERDSFQGAVNYRRNRMQRTEAA